MNDSYNMAQIVWPYHTDDIICSKSFTAIMPGLRTHVIQWLFIEMGVKLEIDFSKNFDIGSNNFFILDSRQLQNPSRLLF